MTILSLCKEVGRVGYEGIYAIGTTGFDEQKLLKKCLFVPHALRRMSPSYLFVLIRERHTGPTPASVGMVNVRGHDVVANVIDSEFRQPLIAGRYHFKQLSPAEACEDIRGFAVTDGLPIEN